MKLIVAVDSDWGIGKNNELLFSLKKDMAFFREKTTGSVVVMGRRTFESLPGQKPLKNRKNIVLCGSHIAGLEQGDCLHVKTLAELFDAIKDEEREVYIIGGAIVYRTMLPYCTEALITKVNAKMDADAHFPNLDKQADWQLISQSQSEKDGDFDITFTVYKNLNVCKFKGE